LRPSSRSRSRRGTGSGGMAWPSGEYDGEETATSPQHTGRTVTVRNQGNAVTHCNATNSYGNTFRDVSRKQFDQGCAPPIRRQTCPGDRFPEPAGDPAEPPLRAEEGGSAAHNDVRARCARPVPSGVHVGDPIAPLGLSRGPFSSAHCAPEKRGCPLLLHPSVVRRFLASITPSSARRRKRYFPRSRPCPAWGAHPCPTCCP
jgi:hypothetical protein